jgi:hypothetical protein
MNSSMENYNDCLSYTIPAVSLTGEKKLSDAKISAVSWSLNYNMITDFSSRSHIIAVLYVSNANYVNYFGMANGYPIKMRQKPMQNRI